MSAADAKGARSVGAREIATFIGCALLYALLVSLLGRVWPAPVAVSVAALPCVGAWLASIRTPAGRRALAWPVVVALTLVAAAGLALLELLLA